VAGLDEGWSGGHLKLSARDAAGLRLPTLDASYRIGRAGRSAMARSLRMPSTHVLPKGPRRDFVEELFEHYRAAKRPTLREISERIRDDELAGTASRETIRRMLLGEVVPLSGTRSTPFF
jgi:hypothetical protein